MIWYIDFLIIIILLFIWSIFCIGVTRSLVFKAPHLNQRMQTDKRDKKHQFILTKLINLKWQIISGMKSFQSCLLHLKGTKEVNEWFRFWQYSEAFLCRQIKWGLICLRGQEESEITITPLIKHKCENDLDEKSEHKHLFLEALAAVRVDLL